MTELEMLRKTLREMAPFIDQLERTMTPGATFAGFIEDAKREFELMRPFTANLNAILGLAHSVHEALFGDRFDDVEELRRIREEEKP